MVYKTFYVLVLWTKVALALEGLSVNVTKLPLWLGNDRNWILVMMLNRDWLHHSLMAAIAVIFPEIARHLAYYIAQTV